MSALFLWNCRCFAAAEVSTRAENAGLQHLHVAPLAWEMNTNGGIDSALRELLVRVRLANAESSLVALGATTIELARSLRDDDLAFLKPLQRRKFKSALADSAAVLLLLGERIAPKGGSGAGVFHCTISGLPGLSSVEPLAVKLMPRTSRPDQVDRLSAEAALVTTLRHPNITRVVLAAPRLLVQASAGCDPAAHVAVVMELLPVTLEHLIAERKADNPRRPFRARRLLAIARDLAAALAYLHGLDPPVLHRDVKPSNLWAPARAAAEDRASDADAAAARPPSPASAAANTAGFRLGDFDISVRTAQPLTEFAGTTSTMAPECFSLEPHHSPADVWSVGMVLQWCLLLEDPFAEAHLAAVDAAVCARPAEMPVFAALEGAAPLWPAELECVARLARRCCARDPAARPSALELLALVEAAEAGLRLPASEGPPARKNAFKEAWATLPFVSMAW